MQANESEVSYMISSQLLQKALEDIKNITGKEMAILDLDGRYAARTDESFIAAAEAKYNSEKAKLNAKEETLDLKMKNLDTEISALTTEYDSVKNTISKQIEKSFKNRLPSGSYRVITQDTSSDIATRIQWLNAS